MQFSDGVHRYIDESLSWPFCRALLSENQLRCLEEMQLELVQSKPGEKAVSHALGKGAKRSKKRVRQ